MLGAALLEFAYPWGILLFFASWIALRFLVFVFPQLSLEHWIYRFFGSDIFGFTLLLLVAALVSVTITWLHIFLQVLLIITAETLAQIDLKNYSFGDLKILLLLSVVPPAGVSLGWMIASYLIL